MSSPLSAPWERNNENPKADSEASASTASLESGSRGGKEGQSSPCWEHNSPWAGHCKQEGCGQDLSAAAALLTASVPTSFDPGACGILCPEINTLGVAFVCLARISLMSCVPRQPHTLPQGAARPSLSGRIAAGPCSLFMSPGKVTSCQERSPAPGFSQTSTVTALSVARAKPARLLLSFSSL